jgi:hypothetical protein
MIPFDTIDFAQPLEPQLRNILATVKAPLDGSVPVTIIVPGQATLAVLLFIYLHGLLGHYPAVCLLQSDATGIFRPTSLFHIDPSALRFKGRALRQEMLRKATGEQ